MEITQDLIDVEPDDIVALVMKRPSNGAGGLERFGSQLTRKGWGLRSLDYWCTCSMLLKNADVGPMLGEYLPYPERERERPT